MHSLSCDSYQRGTMTIGLSAFYGRDDPKTELVELVSSE